ncbi:MAG: LysE family translocator, partial [Caldilineaceae bacterium]
NGSWTMELPVLLRGMIVGLGIAAPVGPIGLLVIQRTLEQGRLVGLFSGLGAATADLIYGLIAAFGLTLVAQALTSVQNVLAVIGGLFLIWLGASTLLRAPATQAARVTEDVNRRGLLGAWASTLLLTLTNPLTILAFAAILSGAGLLDTGGSTGQSLLLVAGVALGSALWWLLLSGGVSFFRHRVSPVALLWVNRSAGVLLVGFGLFALWTALAG